MSTPPPLTQVRALLTDVFGTVVNWRATVTSALRSAAHAALNDASSSIPSSARAAAADVDWAQFAQAWREAYYAFTQGYDADAHGGKFVTIDEFFRRSLGELCGRFGVEGLWSAGELDGLTAVWHRLEPWGDSAKGIGRLSGPGGLEVATLSNGNTGLLTDLAAFGGLKYTKILSAQDFQAYKPSPKVYLGAAEKLGLRPEQCGMVAAHLGDLKAARACGMRTIYIERESEEAWDVERVKAAKDEGWVDLWIGLGQEGLIAVAEHLDKLTVEGSV